MAKSREQKLALATRASLELLLFNTEQSSENKKDASRIKELENENAKLKLDVNDAKNKASTFETANTSLQNDLAQQKELTKEKDKSIAELEEKITNLQLNTEKLEIAKASWESDSDKKAKEAFGNGIKTYCKTFLAGEPNYNWSTKFGKSMVGFMADLAAKNSEEIAEKRAELEQMVANEAQELAQQQEDLMQQNQQNSFPATDQDNMEGDNITTT